MKTDLLQSCGHCWVAQICWHIEFSTLTASSFRTGITQLEIPSPPLALFVMMLPKTHLTSHSRMSGSRWVITPSWLTGSDLQFSLVVQSCSTLCDPMNRSTPGLPVHHRLPEITQTHAHRVGDAVQPSHPLSSPSPPTPNPSQHQGLFQWVNSSHEVVKVLEFQLQHQSFQWIPRTDLL